MNVRVVVLSVALAGLLGSAPARAQEDVSAPSVDAAATTPEAPAPAVLPSAGLPVPPPLARRVEVEHQESLRALWLPGLVALPASWVVTWVYASSFVDGEALAYAWIPVAGPWLMLSHDMNGQEGGVIALGAVQGLSLLAIVLGLSIHETWTSTELVVEPVPGVQGTLSFEAAPLPGGGLASATLRL